MKRLDRYIIMHIFALTAIVGLGLMAIHTFIGFVSEMDAVGRGGYGYWELFQYVLWLSPNGLYVLLPIIALIGTLMGLGTLSGQSELTAMQAAGVSVLRIGRAVAMAGIVLGMLSLVLGDWIAPRGQEHADRIRAEARYGMTGGVSARPIWLRDGRNVFHIKNLLAEDRIGDTQIYTLGPDLDLAAATQVEEGHYVDGRWVFRNVRRTELGERSAQVVQQAEMLWEGALSPEVLRLFVLESDALSIAGLWRLIRYLHDNNLDAAEYELELWRKLAAPFTVVTMMLFAVPFVLGTLRTAGAGQRLLVGIVVGLGFYVINEVTANTGQLFQWSPIISATAPTLGFALVALWRLQHAR